MSSPILIILRHGPNSFFQANMQGMPDGEPYEAEILDTHGNAISVLYIGQVNAQNAMIGGGFQQYTGNLRDVVAPIGTTILDQDMNMWTSNGSGWKQQGGGSVSAANIDCGSFW